MHVRVVRGFCCMVDTVSNVADGFRYWMITVRVSWLVVLVSREFGWARIITFAWIVSKLGRG